ncbi:MAG: hypothetical protein HY360_17730 [Verrucomicrobia bacterium]|nr:hypothetical protein [Verrucomicrobiota bacterium]
MAERYENLSREELIRLLAARDRRDATRFGLVWESNEIERDKALNADFVALDLLPEHSVGGPPWRNLIIEGDNFDALRCLRMAFAGRVLLLHRTGDNRWAVVQFHAQSGRATLGGDFRIADAAGY